MSKAKRFVATHAASLAAIALLALAGGGVAAATAHTTGSAHPNRTSAVPRVSRSQVAQRARLIARKRRDGHHRRARKASAALTYPDQGVQIDSPSPSASSLAASSSMSTSSAAVASFQGYPAAQSAFGSALTSGSPKASLATVTEQDPIASGVAVGVPYQAWAINTLGPAQSFGGSGTTPPAETQCEDVGIYDLALGKWTELLQSCPNP